MHYSNHGGSTDLIRTTRVGIRHRRSPQHISSLSAFNISSRYHFWLRIGIALIPDALLTLVSLVLILNPMHHSTYSFHPVFALTTSLIMMSLYINVVWLNPIIALSNEIDFPHSSAWYNMALTETGIQVLLCITWILLMGYSCAAVRNWRATKNPKAVKMARIEVQEGNESENGRV
jgi:hypothetical protein